MADFIHPQNLLRNCSTDKIIELVGAELDSLRPWYNDTQRRNVILDCLYYFKTSKLDLVVRDVSDIIEACY